MVDRHSDTLPAAGEFLASHGGPFYELQLRLNLLHEHALRSGQRAIIFIGLAWVVPLLLGLPRSLSFDMSNGLTFLTDISVWARFFIAIGAFILAEQQVEQRLEQTLRQVVSAPVIAASARPHAAAAVNYALRQRNSGIAEIVCLVIAALAAGVVLRHHHVTDQSSWAVMASPGGNSITAAGLWSIIVSVPLFWFLALRGLWRHFVWSALLRKIAHLDLRLVSTHPDGKGGIGFLADYPNAYMISVFGISCAVAAAVAQNILHETATMTNVGILMGAWLILILALFAYPLSAFSMPLARLKQASLSALGAQATRYHRMAERKLIGANIVGENIVEADNEKDGLDPTKQFELTRKLSVNLVSRSTLLPVSAAALLPFLVVASTRVPFKEVLSLVKKLLLL